MAGAARLRRRLAENLRREGAVRDARWAEAFRTVPRHVFLPRFFVPDGRGWRAVAREDDGGLVLTYSPNVLVTQLDDDPSRWTEARAGGPVHGTPTSSSSMPAIMAIMLEALLVSDGKRVLEIGTGTGYNAALLCHRLGESSVSTVDIDPVLVESAVKCLAECGFAPTCEIYDGAQGFPREAPFDRVLCTCSVSSIPPAWLEQVVPGGLIVTTLNRPIGAGLLRIVAGEGATGQGRVLARDGRFMPLRAHRLADPASLLASLGGPADRRRPVLPFRKVVSPTSRFEFYAGLRLPGVIALRDFLLHPDGSWARHHLRDGEHVVEQGGPRRLWDVVERAHADWSDLGEPARDRFGVTLGPEGQFLWLDAPTSRHRWPLAES
jgi:methyltransferase of ATP-grasp peptide maturase system